MNTPDLIVDRGGRPRWFMATPDELERAVAAIPVRTLEDAYRDAGGAGLGLDELRERVLAAHLQAAERMPTELVLPLVQAAEQLGREARELRYAIESGSFERPEAVRRTRGGGLALAFQPPPRRWALVPERLRPDPRLTVA